MSLARSITTFPALALLLSACSDPAPTDTGTAGSTVPLDRFTVQNPEAVLCYDTIDCVEGTPSAVADPLGDTDRRQISAQILEIAEEFDFTTLGWCNGLDTTEDDGLCLVDLGPHDILGTSEGSRLLYSVPAQGFSMNYFDADRRFRLSERAIRLRPLIDNTQFVAAPTEQGWQIATAVVPYPPYTDPFTPPTPTPTPQTTPETPPEILNEEPPR